MVILYFDSVLSEYSYIKLALQTALLWSTVGLRLRWLTPRPILLSDRARCPGQLGVGQGWQIPGSAPHLSPAGHCLSSWLEQRLYRSFVSLSTLPSSPPGFQIWKVSVDWAASTPAQVSALPLSLLASLSLINTHILIRYEDALTFIFMLDPV